MRSLVFAAVALLALTPSAPIAKPQHRIWFAPGPGTLDYLALFRQPQDWRKSRELVDVFKFYQGHTQPTNNAFAPNTYPALVEADAFRTVKKWGKALAIEVGVVKEFYCTSDASGMAHAVEDTLASVRAVQAAGGAVDYLAMDDPFASGQSPVCGGPALEPTADRIATFMKGVQGAVPVSRIGLIEAYPFSTAAALETALELLRARGASPAFLHMDVDLNAIRAPNDFVRDMRRLRDVCAARGMPFGIILWGNNADADALYAADVGKLVNATTQAFASWEESPDDLIIQSWAQTRSGLWITPTNLPETTLYTHTELLWQIYRRLRGRTGQTGSSTGTAIPR
jgi:hypothetical protein